MLRLHLPVLLLVLTLPMMPQAPPAPALKLGPVVVQGSLRSRVEMWDWFQGSANNDYAFSGNIFRLSFSQARKSFDWQLEFAAPFLLGLPDDAIAPAPQLQLGLGGNYYAANHNSRNAGMVFVKQGFLRFKNLFGSPAQNLRIGRFEFSDGGEAVPKNATLAAVKRDRVSQRLVGPFGWSHVGRSFDGFHYQYNRPKINYTLMGGIATRGAFQVDGWGELKTGLIYASATGQVNRKRGDGEWRVLALYYHDWRHVLKTDNRPLAARRADLANIRIGTFGGHYMHALATAAGTVDVLLWGVLQAGRWGRLDHRSGAADLEAGWQPSVLPSLKPWIRGGFYHGHGDGDPADGTHTTFFQVLPTPRPFARFPFFNMMNNQDFFGSLAVRPHKAVTLRTEVHALRLADSGDLWYQGGGAFQPWSFGYIGRAGAGRGLATLYDLSADWNVNAHFTLGGYFGYAVGKSAISSIYPRGKDGRFGYLELTYRF